MTHPPPRRRRDPSNETHRGLVGRVILPQEIRRVFLRAAANLPDHDDPVCLLVLQEHLQAVDEVRPAEGVAADADHERLPETGLGGLVDGFVGQGSGPGDDADAAPFVDEAWHNADLALARGDDARAVGAYEAGLALRFEDVCDPDHVVLRDAFSNAHDQGHFGGDGFFDTGGG